MDETVQITAGDGHRLDAYRVLPEGTVKGGVILIQEIFGINEHIRNVARDFAAQGYGVLAPALFDRAEKNMTLPYDEEGFARGRELRADVGWDTALLDIEAARGALQEILGENIATAAVGYCWGGSLCWLAACRLPVSCAVAYYGAQIIDFLDETPKVPVMMHFGETDDLIPPETVKTIGKEACDAEIFTYPAGHGFNCDMRSDFDEASARLARGRSLNFLEKNLA